MILIVSGRQAINFVEEIDSLCNIWIVIILSSEKLDKNCFSRPVEVVDNVKDLVMRVKDHSKQMVCAMEMQQEEVVYENDIEKYY